VRWAGHVALCGRNVYTVFVEESEKEKKKSGTIRLRWEYNIKMHLEGT
jgi:hypothetical protein